MTMKEEIDKLAECVKRDQTEDVLRQVWANVFAHYWCEAESDATAVMRADEAVQAARKALKEREVLR